MTQFFDNLTQSQPTTSFRNNDGTWTGTLNLSQRILASNNALISGNIDNGDLTITRQLLGSGNVSLTYDFIANKGNPENIGPGIFSTISSGNNVISNISLFINGAFVANSNQFGSGFTINIPTRIPANNMRLVFNIPFFSGDIGTQTFTAFRISGSSLFNLNTCGY